MRFNTKPVVRLALVGLAAASMAACATKPKLGPQPPAGPTDTGPQNPDNGPYTPPPGPGQIGQQVLPGSSQDFVINAGDFVYFDFDSYTLRDDAFPVLNAQADWLRRYPNVAVRVEGNADERGTREYNLALGARRANAVRDYLVSRGVQTARIATLSYGKEKPADPGTSEEAYAKNRNGQTVITSGAR